MPISPYGVPRSVTPSRLTKMYEHSSSRGPPLPAAAPPSPAGAKVEGAIVAGAGARFPRMGGGTQKISERYVRCVAGGSQVRVCSIHISANISGSPPKSATQALAEAGAGWLALGCRRSESTCTCGCLVPLRPRGFGTSMYSHTSARSTDLGAA